MKTNQYLIKRAEPIGKILEKYIHKKDKIIDIGTGSGRIALYLHTFGYKVTLLDRIKGFNKSGLKLYLYDGNLMPFKNREFDVGIMVDVIHHAEDVDLLLFEAKRICKRVIIIEDVANNWPERIMLYLRETIGEIHLLKFGYYPLHHFHNSKELESLGFRKLEEIKTFYCFRKFVGEL
jgi:SAM-dependent methyltransferase